MEVITAGGKDSGDGIQTRTKFGPKRRPTTEEQQERRAQNRCPNICPPVEGMFTQASESQCIMKRGHNGYCKIDFGWTRFPFKGRDS